MILANHGIVSSSGALPSTLLNNLYAVYKAENNANDSLGTYNGTAQGGLTYGSGKSGNAFLFNGTNAYVALPNNSMKLTGDFTLTAWVNFGTSKIQSIISCYNYTGLDYGYMFFIDASDKLSFYWDNSGANQVNAPTAITKNIWNMVTVTRDVANSTLKFYINGVLNHTYTNSLVNNINYNTTINHSNIGAQNNSSFFNSGLIDEVNVWNRVLTQSEITELQTKYYPY
jgi:hypothetical protein